MGMRSRRQKLAYSCLLFSVFVCICTELLLTRNFEPEFLASSYDAAAVSATLYNDTMSIKRVIVTGAAGFIGFHLAKTLAVRGHTVVALDNFNDYYDVRLKMDRAYELSVLGVHVYRGDVCNTGLLRHLFAQHSPTHLVHLAAQAGVRYSLVNPYTYIRSNVQCQVALFDVVRKYPLVRLVYASSSSVYGKHSSIPFRLSTRGDRPGNMYSATKVTDELLSSYYCQRYGMNSVGLRFFTVYGPYGRPDMAVYKFSLALKTNNPIPMFHVSDEQPLSRDFTYVDDIISGVVASLDYKPSSCGEKFNLGFGRPVSVPAMIDVLQRELMINGVINKLPLPATEMLETWADTSLSEKLLGFIPKIDLNVGTKLFVDWFRNYYDVIRKNGTRTAAVNEFYWRLLLKQRRLQYQYDKIRSTEESNELRDKMNDADSRLAALHTVKTITGNSTVTTRPKAGYHLNKEKLDTCKTILNTCPPHSICVMTPTGVHNCVCRSDYRATATACLPRLAYTKAEKRDQLALHVMDMRSVHNASTMKRNRAMHFFAGVESPGGDYMFVDEYQRSPSKLQAICGVDPLCVAITTNGVMKKRVQSMARWQRLVRDKDQPQLPNQTAGMYVYDINYCYLDDRGCPVGASCQLMGSANSRCRCDRAHVMQNGECQLVRVTPAIDSSVTTRPH